MTVTFPLPTELQGVGRVVGRFIVVTPDTISDADVYPEARGATGTVTFTPSTKLSKTTDYHAFVGHPSKTFPVDAYGIMQDEELTGGVWLREDTYTVSYNLAGLNIASHTIDVTSAHTNETPLVLSLVGPSEPPVGTTLVMLEVPSGPVDGQVLSWSGTTGLVWSAGVPIAVPTASTTVKGISELATSEETVTGTDNTRVTTPAGVKAALDAKSVSDMSTYVVQADLPTWTSLAGKPAVVAAGTTQADARTAIGAGTSNLTIGTTSTTAKAGNYTPPDASTTVKGIIELATTVDATTGTDTTRAVTPAGLKAAMDAPAPTVGWTTLSLAVGSPSSSDPPRVRLAGGVIQFGGRLSLSSAPSGVVLFTVPSNIAGGLTQSPHIAVAAWDGSAVAKPAFAKLDATTRNFEYFSSSTGAQSVALHGLTAVVY